MRREGDVLTASSIEFVNQGAVHGAAVEMEGLHGTLSPEAIRWSNGVVWSNTASVAHMAAAGGGLGAGGAGCASASRQSLT